MKILIDADACPRTVMKILLARSKAHNIPLLAISSINHQITGVNNIMVDDGPQAVDIAIINKTNKGDIVVTQDWGLASLILSKGAYCIAPKGFIYSNHKMDFMLEERHLKEKIRKSGGKSKGPSPRTSEDDNRFIGNLEKLIKKTTI